MAAKKAASKKAAPKKAAPAPAKKAAPKKSNPKPPSPRGANQTGGGYIRKYEASKRRAAPEIRRRFTDELGQGNSEDIRAYVSGKYMGDNSGYRLDQRYLKAYEQFKVKDARDLKNFLAKDALRAKGKK